MRKSADALCERSCHESLRVQLGSTKFLKSHCERAFDAGHGVKGWSAAVPTERGPIA